jgi:hypothetical protein
MSASTPVKPETPARKASRPRKPLRRLLALLLVLAVAAALTPPVFQFAVLHAAVFFAKRRDVDLRIEKVGGSIFEPVSFYGVKASAVSSSRTTASFEAPRVDVDWSLAALVFKAGAGCVRAIAIDGLNGRFDFPANDSAENSPAENSNSTANESTRHLWPIRLLPSKIDVSRVNLTFQQGENFVRLENLRCAASDTEPGTVQFGKIVVKQPWLAKTFPSAKGVAALQNSRLSLADIALGDNVKFKSISSDLAELSRGQLKAEFDIDAFSGAIRGEINGAAGKMHSQMEVNGSFAQISVQELANFFDFNGKAGGLINEGNFSFNGSLRNLQKATFKIYLEAADFQLGKRRWNSLVGGATLVEHHIQIPGLRLVQAHNELNLKGEMILPTKRIEWWQSEFAFDIAAKIDNLAELSALFGPEFADAGGRATIDGSVKGADQSFNGELAIAGDGLSYRKTPVEKLRASIKLSGNELQVASLELSNKSDFVRGKGVVNILGQEKRYWGELKASVAELALYSALLQKPLVPQPPAGGLTVDWSGDGTANAHSGAFKAQLKKFRLVSVTEPKAHPLNADLEATYSPGNIFFSKFVVSDSATSFSAKVSAAPKTLNLQAVRIAHEDAVWLEGDALLPFNIWSAWQNASWSTLLEFDSPCKISLAAKNLDLHAVAMLCGRQLPVKGELQMNLTTDGTMNDLSADGKLSLKKAQVNFGDDEPDVVGAEGELTLVQQTLQTEKFQIRFNALEYEATGKIDFKNLRDPNLDIGISGKKIPLVLRPDTSIDADLDLNLRGTFGHAIVSGTAQLLDLKLAEKPSSDSLLDSGGDLQIAPVFPFDTAKPPFDKWQLDVALATPEPAKISWPQKNDAPKPASAALLKTDCSARGTGADIRLAGRVDFQNVEVASAHAQLTINEGTVEFFGDTTPPWFAVAVSGKASGENVTGWIFGQAERRSSFFLSASALSQEEILSLIKTGMPSYPHAIADLDTVDAPLELKGFSAPAAPLFDLRTQ